MGDHRDWGKNQYVLQRPVTMHYELVCDHQVSQHRKIVTYKIIPKMSYKAPYTKSTISARKSTVSATKLTATSCRIQVVADLSPKPATKSSVSATKLTVSATKSTVPAAVDFVADLSPVSATVDFVCTGLNVPSRTLNPTRCKVCIMLSG